MPTSSSLSVRLIPQFVELKRELREAQALIQLMRDLTPEAMLEIIDKLDGLITEALRLEMEAPSNNMLKREGEQAQVVEGS